MSLQETETAVNQKDAAIQKKRDKAAALHSNRKRARQAQHDDEAKKLSEMIVEALGRSRNLGVAYADSEELLMMIVAIEIGFIREIPTVKLAEQKAKQVDSHRGRRQRRQGDRWELLQSAMKAGEKNGLFLVHREEDGFTGIYLPQNQPPKWTVFFAESERGIEDYVPSQRDLANVQRITDFNDRTAGEEVTYSDSYKHLLRLWGQQFEL